MVTIGQTVFTAIPNRGNAAMFTGATDAQVHQFFLELTGVSSLPAPRTIPGKGSIYVVNTPGGNFTLRDFSSSSGLTGPAWTIDLPKNAVGMTYNPEIKFIKGGAP
jgi:filamentous hemagglutinin